MSRTSSTRLSRRVEKLRPSATFRLAKKAAELRAAGKDVLSFGLGEPDFDTPKQAREAGKLAIDEGKSHYTANEGIPELREAIASSFEAASGVAYDPGSEVLVSTGAKQSLANAVLALVDEGDEVLIPTPFWLSYPEMVSLAGGDTRFVPTHHENGFHLEPEDLEKAITPKSRVLFFNSPNNPTGAVIDRKRLEGIASLVVEHDLIVISDEIYAALIYGDLEHHSIVSIDPRLRERTVVCHGVSKSFAMTGWRIGFALAPNELIGPMSKVQSHTTSNASSIAQYAATAAIKHCLPDVEAMRQQFEERRMMVHERLAAIPGMEVPVPEGAFYAFPRIRELFGKNTPTGKTIEDSSSFCEALIEEKLVSLIPGLVFGADDCVRLSYAASLEDLERGCDRITSFVNELS